MLNGTSLYLVKATVHPKLADHTILASEDAVLLITSIEKMPGSFIKKYRLPEPENQATPLIRQTIRELREYFSHKRHTFTVPFLFTGSPFQKKVYRALYEQVRYGETISYQNLAGLAGYPRAARAVGTAMKNNPLPFVIPCHRVIRADGSPGEYGGGTDTKIMLINMEKSAEF
jgi:methylated-DNA-[protein]-cysteine S-methyltransferase